MKKRIATAIMLFALLACKNHQSSEMKDVSVSLSGIEFSKAVNDADNYYQKDEKGISLEGVSKTNYFIAPDGSRNEASAPILLTPIDNKKPFTFTAKLRSKIETTYDAGTLYLYVNNSNWLKFAFELDEKGRKRVVTVKTQGSSDDNNHDIIVQDYVYMKISSDTKQVGFYYSTNGSEWNLARLYRNDYPADLWIGISSQSPRGKGNVTYFEEMSFAETHVANFRLGE